MNPLIERFSNVIKGCITGFDRIVFKGLILPLAYAKGAMSFCRSNKILNKNYKKWMLKQTELLIEVADQYAKTNWRCDFSLTSANQIRQENHTDPFAVFCWLANIRLDCTTNWFYFRDDDVLTQIMEAAMIKTLTKHGNSLALVIEKPVLELLGADAQTPFDVTTDGQVLILSPIKDSGRNEAFSAALDKVNARYPKALKKLAE